MVVMIDDGGDDIGVDCGDGGDDNRYDKSRGDDSGNGDDNGNDVDNGDDNVNDDSRLLDDGRLLFGLLDYFMGCYACIQGMISLYNMAKWGKETINENVIVKLTELKNM